MPWSKRIPVLLSAHSRCRIFRGQWQEATGKAAISSQHHSAIAVFLSAPVPIQDRKSCKPVLSGLERFPTHAIRDRSYSIDLLRVIYCGLEASRLFGFEEGTGSAGLFLTGGSSREGDAFVEGMEAIRGASGPVVIALSGFSRRSWLGPKPSLIKARESGTVLDCQPWSA
jgi:hypothetical protein